MISDISWLEWLGYSGSVIVAVSLTMSSIKKLRWYNLVGASVFTIYGFLIQALPVAFLNLFIVIADIYYLINMYSSRESFSSVVISIKDQYLAHFLNFHQKDIAQIFSGFNREELLQKDHLTAMLLLRNADVAGAFIGEQIDDTFHVYLDYVTVKYRDLRSGDYLFNKHIGFFKQNKVRKIEAKCNSMIHQKYLMKMGFKPVVPDSGVYVRVV